MYAGFWRRFGAFIIDFIALLLIFLIVIFPAVFILTKFSFGKMVLQFIPFFSVILIFWLYYSLMESSTKQATIGKLALGIRVTDLNGNKISFGRASGRFFSKFLSGIFGLGYIVILFTKRKQGLHDIISGCLVVKKGISVN